MSITCGNRARHTDGGPAVHASVKAVRACYLAPETWDCEWMFALTHPEDGLTYTILCGGLSWFLVDGRGYTCESGHEEIYAEVRAAERWDYAADPEEAGLLAGCGVQPVAMNGGGIDIDPGAFHYAAGLPASR